METDTHEEKTLNVKLAICKPRKGTGNSHVVWSSQEEPNLPHTEVNLPEV